MKLTNISTRDLSFIFIMLITSFTLTNSFQSDNRIIDENLLTTHPKMLSNWKISEVELINHTPIVITNNSDFNNTNGVISGNGTKDNPFVIANWFIESSGNEHCISIADTTSYFIIENCTLTGAINSPYMGLRLSNVYNSYIQNNIVLNNYYGIYLGSSSSNVLINNSCSALVMSGAITLISSSYNTITRNHCFSTFSGIYLYESSSNNITYNLGSYNNDNLLLSSNSNNNNIENNIGHDSGVGITIQSSISNILSSNTLNDNYYGIRLYGSAYENTIHNNTMIGNTKEGILCSESTYNTFTNNFIKDNGDGIGINSGSSNNTISNNNIINSKDIGVKLQDSSNNSFTLNRLSNNTNYSFNFSNSIDNNISYNWIWLNGDTFGGNSGSNVIYNNFFYPPSDFDSDEDGLTDEFELGFGTNPLNNDSDRDLFNDGDELLWGSDPLDFHSYPLPPSVFIYPIPSFINTDSFTLDYTVSKGNVTIYINGVANTTAQSSGSLLSGLEEGSYNLTVAVIDALGKRDNDSIFFTIDTSIPVITISNPISTFYNQTSVILTYTVSEGVTTIYIDGVANNTAQTSESVISGLDEGIHTITIVAVDKAGNFGIAAISFVIDTSTEGSQVVYSTSVIYETILITQSKSTTDLTFITIFAGLVGIFIIKSRRK